MKYIFQIVILIPLVYGTDLSAWKQPETANAIEAGFEQWRLSRADIRDSLHERLSKQPNLQEQVSSYLDQDTLMQLSQDAILASALKHKNLGLNNLVLFDTSTKLTIPGLGQSFSYNSQDSLLIEQLVLKELTKDIDGQAMLKGNNPISEYAENLLKAIMAALEFEARWLFDTLAPPFMTIAVLLDPLPKYRHTIKVLDGVKPMKYIDQPFDNWGSTLHNEQPIRIFYPETRVGVQNIVKMAAREGKRVRASGMRHTWNPWIWGVPNDLQPQSGHDADYFIAMVPNEVSDHLSYARGTHEAWRNRADDLTSIEGPLDIWTETDGQVKAAVKVGAATLNQHLFEWILEKKQWTLPLDTIMLLMTYGGTTSPMCHGGGLQHKSLSDQVIGMEYVDSQGNIHEVTDPRHLKAAAGSFGMLGIVLSLTFKMDAMTYARWGPQIVDLPMEEYFPRPEQAMTEDLKQLLTNHYYAEWIAYPSHHMGSLKPVLWQNVWDNEGRKEDAVELVDPAEETYQITYAFLAEVGAGLFKAILYEFDAQDYLYWLYGWMSGAAARLVMKDIDDPITTPLTEALHFQRGLHTLTVKAMELNIPIPDDGEGNPDWTIVQKAWWDGQDLIKQYEANGQYPVDYAMEMRLMSGSDMYMAPYYGNVHGTVSIEVCSSALVPAGIWENFKSDLATVWAQYKDKEGRPLKIRPHWAKEFPAKVGEQSINDYVKDVYKDQIPIYMNTLKEIIATNNGNLRDTQERFSTKYLDVFFQDHW